MDLIGLTREELVEIKKALNELYSNRMIFLATNTKYKESNEKYKEMDLKLIKQIIDILNDDNSFSMANTQDITKGVK